MAAEPHDPSDQRIIDVLLSHRRGIRDGCHVPTRAEVATLEPQRLECILLGWWWESPSELIPTDAEVANVVEALRARPDADTPKIQKIIAQAPPPDADG